MPIAAETEPAAVGTAIAETTTRPSDTPAAAEPTDAPVLPSFAPTPVVAPDATQRRWRAGTALAVIVLGGTLLLQLLLASRMDLARQAAWRPLLLQTCAVLRCSLPDWHEPDAITLLQRDVQPHPRQPELLRVTATFRNDAAWPQPWPTLVLSLSGSDGAVVGARAFSADSYLGGPPEQRLIGSGQRASIAVDIHQPAQPAVAFDFTIR